MLQGRDDSSRTVLPSEGISAIDAYWRAANYCSVGQIYLLDNPLLREPLRAEHAKPRLMGHFGTTPGLNLVYAHLNRVIVARDLDMIYVTGPGHGGPGIVANTYLEGTYSEFYPHITQDEDGLRRLFRQFSFPGGIPSHVSPGTPGSIHEGGELGYSLVHAYGAALGQSGSHRGLRHRGRGGRDGAAGRRPGTPTSSSTPSEMARCCPSSISTGTRSPTRPSWLGSATTSCGGCSRDTATARSSSRAMTPSMCTSSWPPRSIEPSTRSRTSRPRPAATPRAIVLRGP